LPPASRSPERSFVMANSLVLDPLKCNGCRECETACSLKRTGLNDPALSCIRIMTDAETEGFYLPVVCFQCSEAPCVAACPVEAIYRDEDKRVMIKSDRCIGCRMCFAACPFGAMGFDQDRGRAFKCDHCGGDPECVRRCEPKALVYVDTTEVGRPRLEISARRFVLAASGRMV
jgi:carbon-monoxide dehydrogenase iron sulfur subunit